MSEIDPATATAVGGTGIASWWIIRWFFSRSIKRVDDLEERLEKLEQNAATHADIKQLREAIENGNRSIHERIDGLYKLWAEKPK